LLTLLYSDRKGTSGVYDQASNADLDNEFGTHVDVEVLQKILHEGSLTEGHVSGDRRD
jgi:ribosome maturation protein Sdo1